MNPIKLSKQLQDTLVSYLTTTFDVNRDGQEPALAAFISQVLSVGYNRTGALLYVNEGLQGSGFKICPKCGKHVNKRSNKCDGFLNGQPCPGKLDLNTPFTLGFKQATDTLHLKFTSTSHIVLPEPDDMSFWLSLKYALLQGASRALQIERKDIDGVLLPETSGQDWGQSIVLYDNVPGGAGHVKQIEKHKGEVIASALKIIDCDCERSCYRCLKEYGNQWEHHLLDRTPIAEFLRALDADLQQSSLAWSPVSAVNPSVWLWEHLQRIQQEIIVFADQITLQSPTAEGLTWLDLLQRLLQCGNKVRLYLNRLPDQASGSGEAILITTHLRLLLQKRLDLRQFDRQLPCVAILDPDTPNASAIRTPDNKTIELGSEGISQLAITTHVDIVRESWQAIKQYTGRVIGYGNLREPADTQVREVIPDGKTHNEAEYFSDFYATPVRGMVISDRYLMTETIILDRIGAHIELAQQNQTLEWVLVKTRQSNDEQKHSIQQLKSRFPHVKIRFDFEWHTAHDRYIEITRADGNKARVIIGAGLDFIEPNGKVRNTFLVFQTSYTNS